MGENFYKKATLVLLFFLSLFLFIGVLQNIVKDYGMTGFATHSKYPEFSSPEQGFSYNSGSNSVSVSDDAVYGVGYYSINGSNWQSFSLSGSQYDGNGDWKRGPASFSPIFFGVGEHYIIIYSCKYAGSNWDCHGNNWQLIEINNSLPANNTLPCTDTCGSLGYQCGTRSICGLSVECGNCSQGYNCTNNVCVYSPSPQNVTCSNTVCGAGEYCFKGVCLLNVSGKTYFIALNGSDNNPGTFEAPFYSWQKGVQVARPGDIVYIREGVWKPTQHIMRGSYNTGGIAMAIEGTTPGFGVSGTAEAPIRYYNYPGEKPIMDGSLLTPNQDRWQSGISIGNVEHIYMKGLTVRQIHQIPPDHNPATNHGKNYSEVFGIGSFESANLRFENMVSHDIDGRGFQHWSGSWSDLEGPGSPYDSDNTSWINCDSYNLYDRYSNYPGNAADGWKVVGSPHNYFYWEGCRAWNYSDDGFDPNGAHRFFKNCWAMSTDYFEGLSDSWDVEGNGFKVSGISPEYAQGYSLNGENYVKFENCIAAHCSGIGFYNNILINFDDSWPNNGLVYNNLGYKNQGNFWSASVNNQSQVHTTVFRNNIAYESTYDGQGYSPLYEVGIYNPAVYPHSNNTWRATPAESWPGWEYNPAYSVTDGDFVSLDYWQLTRPRKADGSLPDITFGHLKTGSDLIDGGTVIPGFHCSTVGAHPAEDCVEWYGAAPDLGPFEYQP